MYEYKINLTLITTNATLAEGRAIAFCRSKQTNKVSFPAILCTFQNLPFQLSKLYLTEDLHRREFSLLHNSAYI
jgi:hypothetical protein